MDGLRGLAVAAIIGYHAGGGLIPGAFLSVSTFFTLSGFLITTVILAEYEKHGGISLRSFWSRRLRRLMPASLAAIVIILAMSLAWADSTQLARIRGDALSALGYVANWRFVFSGDTYGAELQSASPFTHFWSLAIEEQFYVIYPLIVVGVAVAAKGSRRVLAWVFGSLCVVGVAWTLILNASDVPRERLYFGTDVRSVEFLAGALLAIWWMRRPDPVSERVGRWLSHAGLVALGLMLVLWVTADLQGAWVYRGGLGLYSVVTLTVMLGALQRGSITSHLLSFRPLVWLGTVSYGIYLLHYPILLFLDSRTGLGVAARLLVAVPLTLLIAAASARYFEQPIRRGGVVRDRPAGWAVLAGVSAVALLAVAAGALGQPGKDRVDLSAAQIRYLELQQEEADRQASPTPKVTTFGDSTALVTGIGLTEWGRAHDDVLVGGGGDAQLGCTLTPESKYRSQGRVGKALEQCMGYLDAWAASSRKRPSDVALVQEWTRAVYDQQVNGTGPLRVVGEDPELDALLEKRLREAVEVLLRDNGMVVLGLGPYLEPGRVDGRPPEREFPEADHARMDAFNEIQRKVAASTDRVETIDMAEVYAEAGDEDQLVPDGIHLSEESALTVAKVLGPRLAAMHTERTGKTTTVVRQVQPD